MSELVEKLRAVKIFNDYEIVSDGHPMISLRTHDARSCRCSAVMLGIKGKNFDVPWYDNGKKAYIYLNIKERKEAYEKAFDWIERYFSGMKMVKSPFGKFDYVPEEDLKAAIARAECGGT